MLSGPDTVRTTAPHAIPVRTRLCVSNMTFSLIQ
jgi:hypothetical protein